MGKEFPRLAARYLAAMAAVLAAALVFASLLRGTERTVVVLVFVVIIMLAALIAGIGPGLTAAATGALSYNFFFIPPVGTFAIARSEDIAAFVVFSVTVVIVGALSAAVGRRSREAEAGKAEMEKLNELAAELLKTPASTRGILRTADTIVRIFKLEYCGIHIVSRNGRWQHVSLSAGYPRNLALPDSGALKKDTMDAIIDEQNRQVRYGMMRSTGEIIGMLALKGGEIPADTVTAVAGLVALALRRKPGH